jgi:hypothetical protein
MSRQCGILNISQPYRPPRPVTGIALLFNTLYICCFENFKINMSQGAASRRGTHSSFTPYLPSCTDRQLGNLTYCHSEVCSLPINHDCGSSVRQYETGRSLIGEARRSGSCRVLSGVFMPRTWLYQ